LGWESSCRKRLDGWHNRPHSRATIETFFSAGLLFRPAAVGLMPSGTISVFGDVDDFQAALGVEGRASIVLVQGGPFYARLAQVRLPQMLIWEVEEILPRIAFIECPENNFLVCLPISGRETMVWAGLEIGSRHLVTVGPRQRLHVRTLAPCRWKALWFSAPALAAYGRSLLGVGLAIPDEVRRWNVSPAARRELLDLASVATSAIASHPKPLVAKHATHGLEQQIIHGLVDCLASATPDPDSDLRRRSQRAAVRLEQLFEESGSGDLKTRDIRLAIGVPERFLRRSCAIQLGVGFVCYRKLRLLQAARRALSERPAGKVSITKVARRFGFYHLGRFASEYRQFFGELPSATLSAVYTRQLLPSGDSPVARASPNHRIDLSQLKRGP
jgi:AraC-like DNA-binding protein